MEVCERGGLSSLTVSVDELHECVSAVGHVL